MQRWANASDCMLSALERNVALAAGNPCNCFYHSTSQEEAAWTCLLLRSPLVLPLLEPKEATSKCAKTCARIMCVAAMRYAVSGESNRPLTPILLKYCDTPPISIATLCKSMPSSWQKVLNTPICITIRLPFVAQYSRSFFHPQPPSLLILLPEPGLERKVLTKET